jgi:hypothetical protein
VLDSAYPHWDVLQAMASVEQKRRAGRVIFSGEQRTKERLPRSGLSELPSGFVLAAININIDFDFRRPLSQSAGSLFGVTLLRRYLVLVLVLVLVWVGGVLAHRAGFILQLNFSPAYANLRRGMALERFRSAIAIASGVPITVGSDAVPPPSVVARAALGAVAMANADNAVARTNAEADIWSSFCICGTPL